MSAARPRLAALFFFGVLASATQAQVAPSPGERAGYRGYFAAAASGDAAEVRALLAKKATLDVRDSYGRTPLHVAAFGRHRDVMRLLVGAGADPNALERDRYDIVTIAAVANDVQTLKLALELGGGARNVTSRYDGTALIAAAHLGHVEIVRSLIAAGANVNLADRDGQTPLALARRRGYPAMVRILESARAR